MKEFIYVLDPGKKRDYAAEMIFRDTPQVVEGDHTLWRPDRIIHFMDLVHIDKYKGVSYTDMVTKVSQRCGMVQLMNNHELLVDGLGVGEAVLDIMRKDKLKPIAILSHSGTDVHRVYNEFASRFKDIGGQDQSFHSLKTIKEYHVPKLDLVEAGRIILEQQRLRIAKGLKYSEDFRAQLKDFKPDERHTKKRGYMKFGAEHDDIHDDLVICFIMAAWYIMNRAERRTIPERTITPEDKENKANWNPYDFL